MNWKEAIQPTKPDDIVGQPGISYDMGFWEHTGKLPDSHLLFVGPPGTGKTSTARLIARLMLQGGTESINYHETNGSDDRGIDFVRDVFKSAMRSKPIGDDQKKIMVIDEADGLTSSAQDAMRQLMEDYKDNCLVILTANEQNKIRNAIQSRCKIYHFQRVLPQVGAGRLWDILQKADHTCLNSWEPHLERVVQLHDGDIHEILKGQWRRLRRHLHQSLRDGSSLRTTMNSLYDGLHDYHEDAFFDAMVAYGDVMTDFHEWPGNAYSFCDYMVARIRKEVTKNE